MNETGCVKDDCDPLFNPTVRFVSFGQNTPRAGGLSDTAVTCNVYTVLEFAARGHRRSDTTVLAFSSPDLVVLASRV